MIILTSRAEQSRAAAHMTGSEDERFELRRPLVDDAVAAAAAAECEPRLLEAEEEAEAEAAEGEEFWLPLLLPLPLVLPLPASSGARNDSVLCFEPAVCVLSLLQTKRGQINSRPNTCTK